MSGRSARAAGGRRWRGRHPGLDPAPACLDTKGPAAMRGPFALKLNDAVVCAVKTKLSCSRRFHALESPAPQPTYNPMTSRPVLTPGPDHPITDERNSNRVQVRAGDTKIADTANALTLREAGHPPVQYIPRGDVDMSQLKRSTHSSYWPYKGEAAYFDIPALGERGATPVWTYEQPYAAGAESAGHTGFCPWTVSRNDTSEEDV